MTPAVLERLLGELDARVMPAQDASLHRTPMVGPDGRELSPSEALAYRANAHDAAMRVYLEIARAPSQTLGLPDLRPIPVWAQAAALAVVVALALGQGFLGFMLLILWVKF